MIEENYQYSDDEPAAENQLPNGQNAYHCFWSESMNLTLTDLQSGLMVKPNGFEWPDYLNFQIDAVRQTLLKREEYLGGAINLPGLAECVKMWAVSELETYRLEKLSGKLRVIQRKINETVQEMLDRVYYGGDSYLLALQIHYNPQHFIDLFQSTGASKDWATDAVLNEFDAKRINSLTDLAAPLLEIILPKLDEPAKPLKTTLHSTYLSDLKEYCEFTRKLRKLKEVKTELSQEKAAVDQEKKSLWIEKQSLRKERSLLKKEKKRVEVLAAKQFKTQKKAAATV
jgi:hypothetical protein